MRAMIRCGTPVTRPSVALAAVLVTGLVAGGIAGCSGGGGTGGAASTGSTTAATAGTAVEACAAGADDVAVGLPGHGEGRGAVDVRLEETGTRLLTRSSIGAGAGAVTDRLGAAVLITDLDGSDCPSLVIGAPGADGAGRVFLTRNSAEGFGTATVPVSAPTGAPGDEFGAAVAVTRRTRPRERLEGVLDLWIGAPGRDVGGLVDAGAVEHFRLDAPGRHGRPVDVTHLGTITLDDPVPAGEGRGDRAEAGDRFGEILGAADEYDPEMVDDEQAPTVLVVGVPHDDVGTADDAGSVAVLFVDSEEGSVSAAQRVSQDSAKTPGRAERGDRFGASVAADSELLAVGVPGEDVGGAREAGTVELFGFDPLEESAFSYRATLAEGTGGIPGTAERGDAFGAATAFNGELDSYERQTAGLVVGAPGEDVGPVTDAGAVYHLRLDCLGRYTNRKGCDPEAVRFTQGDGLSGTPEAGDRLGATLSARLVGTGAWDPQVAVPGQDVGGVADAGLVYIRVFAGFEIVDPTEVTLSTGNITGTRYGSVLASDSTAV
ncbi:MAG: hypothetical protein GXX79_15135 [Actinomycetales bacterium]|nr:hypothetical protein [Actinomycetales bacterium]